MSKIGKEDLFRNLKGYLRTKGIELQDGAYTERIRQGCDLLTDAVNVSQQALKNARVAVDQKLERMRQVIHEKTAPKAPASPPLPPEGPNAPGAGASRPRARGAAAKRPDARRSKRSRRS